MTQPNQPYAGQTQPTGFITTAPPPKKKSKALTIVLVAVFGVLALCVGGAVIVGAVAEGTKNAANVTPGLGEGVKPVATTAAPALPAAPVVKPKAADFKLTVKVIKKTCFGSAGCNVSFRIDVAYSGAELDPTTTYEVVYEVRGGEDPLTNSFKVRGDTATYDQEEFIQTKSSSAVLTAVATEINEL